MSSVDGTDVIQQVLGIDGLDVRYADQDVVLKTTRLHGAMNDGARGIHSKGLFH